MSAKRHERTFARRCAVQVLYTSEIQNLAPSVVLEQGLCLVEDGPLSDYAVMLAKGVEEHRADIDERLGSVSENWSVERMPIVDRMILRLAAFEMLYCDQVPVSVTINEAVELAKGFGGEDDSPRFVNGVLGQIARSLEAEGAEEQDELAKEPAQGPAGLGHGAEQAAAEAVAGEPEGQAPEGSEA